jgi:putative addiction module component (TIGR02574 family)
MSMTKEQIISEALKLDREAREEIADALWQSFSPEDQAAIDAEWLALAKRRDDAFQRGEGAGIAVDDAVARIRARAGR